MYIVSSGRLEESAFHAPGVHGGGGGVGGQGGEGEGRGEEDGEGGEPTESTRLWKNQEPASPSPLVV